MSAERLGLPKAVHLCAEARAAPHRTLVAAVIEPCAARRQLVAIAHHARVRAVRGVRTRFDASCIFGRAAQLGSAGTEAARHALFGAHGR